MRNYSVKFNWRLAIMFGLIIIAGSTYSRAELSTSSVLAFNPGNVGTFNDVNLAGSSYFTLFEDTTNPADLRVVGLQPGPDLGVFINRTQTASGNHQSPPGTEPEFPGIDAPWGLFSATGMHLTTAPITVVNGDVNNDGGFTKLLDFSGWSVIYSFWPDAVPLGGDPINFPVDTGLATITCSQAGCPSGSTFILDYDAHIEPFCNVFPFCEGVHYRLHLEGVIMTVNATNASPLSSGTHLTLKPGVGSANNAPCVSGSCIGVEFIPGVRYWADLFPGTDGGFIVGKSQVSGGQETIADGLNPNPTNPGELTAASFLSFGLINGNATVFTPGGTQNLFDDTSCIGVDCIGKTMLESLNVAVNGNSIPVGSAAGCTHANCSAEQMAGIFVNNYDIDPVANTWRMDYSQVASSGGFQGVKFFFTFEGDVAPSCPVVEYAWQVPNRGFLLVFGSNLTGVTSVVIDGVSAPLVQESDGDSLIVIIPPGVVMPWKPGTVEVTTSAGCTGKYPVPCAL